MTSSLKEEIKEAVLKQVPMNAFGQPEDIASAVLFLASPGSRYVTGQVLAVDGGLAM
jgi:3-oxoacyl-[acyl-carrier protein] reductase